MLNGRLYRAAFLPFLLALAVAAFSLGARPAPLGSTLAPDAFEGSRALAETRSLAARFPHRRPGSPGDDALASEVAHTFEGLGGTAGGGFSVHVVHFRAQTIEGERPLETVIAERPGSTGAAPILIVAHRDAAAPGSQAELSATAALLELARVFAERETKRTIVLASTSGGSGGDAGVAQLVEDRTSMGALPGETGAPPLDAAIVLGDLAGQPTRTPMVVPYSDGFGSAPLLLQRTLDASIGENAGTQAGAPTVFGQLAHLAFPLTVGEQGPLDREGIPAVLVQASGERGPSPAEPVSGERLEGLGRAVLTSVDALDTSPDVSRGMQHSLLLGPKTMPAWALGLLIGTLLLPPLALAADGLARLRRRRRPVGRWTLWTLSCSLPFLSCALFVYLLGWLGILGPVPGEPVLPSALPFAGKAVTAVLAVILTFALSWLLWAALMGRLRWGRRPDEDAAGVAMMVVLGAVGVLAWLANPFVALLLLPALHLWLLLSSPRSRPGRPAAVGLVALGLLAPVLVVLFYADQLGLSLGGTAWMAVLLVAGGHVSFPGVVLWSVALGAGATALILALAPRVGPPRAPSGEEFEVTIRGPMSYAGPGSLGGTESALRR